MESSSFTKNQLVFARIHGYPCWPGKIYDSSRISKVPHYIVFLYGFDVVMKFSASKLQYYGDYIQKNTARVCDLLLYAKALEDAQKDFYFSQIQSLQEEASITYETKACKFPNGKASIIENEKSHPPSLKTLVEKKRIVEHPESLNADLGDLYNEINLLRYDYHIKSYSSLKKVNLKKCFTYLCKLRKLHVTKFVLNRNPQILLTLEQLQKYAGDCSRWKLTSEDRKNLFHFAKKIRKLANLTLRFFKQIVSSK
ncbi:hypothetical protein V9T40_010155 [Parthenolecanium corni]|uniref:Lens epithelium-derived growth factor integrase-binding domain-containing protein n=1 Tax=Parthenolecanium corni TaxID=536013 RepID=A0AAN9XXZ4_9HEMI